MLKIILLFILLIFTNGCSIKYDNVTLNKQNQLIVLKEKKEVQARIKELSNMIQQLSTNISKDQANDLAYRSTYYAFALANQYDLMAPALYQNYLVNQKQRKRGLCYHWVTDIVKYLINFDYSTLGIYKVVANKGKYNEHNAISITAKNQSYDKGILLDAWRDSGKLFFIPIKKDIKYKWKLRRKVQ
jgi:hypothetical protein